MQLLNDMMRAKSDSELQKLLRSSDVDVRKYARFEIQWREKVATSNKAPK